MYKFTSTIIFCFHFSINQNENLMLKINIYIGLYIFKNTTFLLEIRLNVLRYLINIDVKTFSLKNLDGISIFTRIKESTSNR